MTHRRDSADGIAGRGAHEVAVGTGERFTYSLGDFRFADTIVAACNDHDCLTALRAAKNDGLRDLGYRAADRGCRVGTGAGRLFELNDLGIDAGVAKELRSAQSGGVPGGFHGKTFDALSACERQGNQYTSPKLEKSRAHLRRFADSRSVCT